QRPHACRSQDFRFPAAYGRGASTASRGAEVSDTANCCNSQHSQGNALRFSPREMHHSSIRKLDGGVGPVARTKIVGKATPMPPICWLDFSGAPLFPRLTNLCPEIPEAEYRARR